MKDDFKVPYEIDWFDSPGPDPEDDNLDIYVVFEDGRKYVGTFFTIENIRSVMNKDKRTGESRGGLYFWASDMIIVERIDRHVIEEAVADLIAEEYFEKAFDGPFFDSPAEE